MIRVVIRSWLNFDGYDLIEDIKGSNKKKHTQFRVDEVDKLKEAIAGKEVIWEKGMNTFTGAVIDKALFESMKSKVVD